MNRNGKATFLISVLSMSILLGSSSAYQINQPLEIVSSDTKRRWLNTPKEYLEFAVTVKNRNDFAMCIADIAPSPNTFDPSILEIKTSSGEEIDFEGPLDYQPWPSTLFHVIPSNASKYFSFNVSDNYDVKNKSIYISAKITAYNCSIMKSGYIFDELYLRSESNSILPISDSDYVIFETSSAEITF